MKEISSFSHNQETEAWQERRRQYKKDMEEDVIQSLKGLRTMSQCRYQLDNNKEQDTHGLPVDLTRGIASNLKVVDPENKNEMENIQIIIKELFLNQLAPIFEALYGVVPKMNIQELGELAILFEDFSYDFLEDAENFLRKIIAKYR